MSKVILNNTEREIPSGFYHDNQKKNPMMRVTLHANTVPPNDILDPWPAWCEKGKPDQDEPKEADYIPFIINSQETKVDVRYGAKPICSSIINEDFNIAIANSWTDFAGGNELNDIINSAKPFEAYAHKVAPLLKNVSEGIRDYIDKAPDTSLFKNNGSLTVGSAIGHLADHIGGKGNRLSRNLVIQGTRFKYYSGTGISFSNLGMRFTLFADYIEDIEENDDGSINYTGNYKFKTPDDQLEDFSSYAIGKYTKFLKDGSLSGKSKNDVVYSETDEKGNTKKLELGDILKKLGMSMEGATGIGPSIEDTINSFFGWQTAPGGFRASIDYVDSVQTGTLMLKIGPYYRLKNLIIQDIQLNYSKHIAKYFDKKEKKVKTCPLYCEVAITFTPANKYSDKMLKEFVMSRGRNSRESNSIMNLEKTINEKINIK